MYNSKFQPVIYSILIIVGIIFGVIINPNDISKKSTDIDQVINLIKKHYVDSINNNDFNDQMINSILTNLDPHSSYINSNKLKEVEEDMRGSFSGIGVQFNLIEDSIVVIAAISGGPSEKLGIISGDRIVEINGENITLLKLNNEDVIERLRGEKGTKVNIKIFRRGYTDLLDFTITRDDIPLYSLDASIMLENNIGYIKINRFSATTNQEFLKGAEELLSFGMKNLIIDLRGNPGGYLDMAIKMCDAILKKENLIVYTEGRNRVRQNIYSTKEGILKNIPVIILIDEGSASASEIVAGALQDNDRGLIIGRRSFGKGLVQEQINLNDGSVIRLTTQRYYTPSGRCIQKSFQRKNLKNYVSDSTIYHTKKGRVVYGGGGITPDTIIPRDSLLNYSKVNYLINKGWVNEFCILHSIKLKETITKELFISNNDNNAIYTHFLDFLKQKDVNIDMTIGTKELSYFKTLLKAMIGKNIWDNNVYFNILNKEDEFVQKAIDSFQ